MRGVLMAWMRQSEMLERWKENQDREFALYTLVGLQNSSKLEGDQYNHLQVNSLFLILLALVSLDLSHCPVSCSLMSSVSIFSFSSK